MSMRVSAQYPTVAQSGTVTSAFRVAAARRGATLFFPVITTGNAFLQLALDPGQTTMPASADFQRLYVERAHQTSLFTMVTAAGSLAVAISPERLQAGWARVEFAAPQADVRTLVVLQQAY